MTQKGISVDLRQFKPKSLKIRELDIVHRDYSMYQTKNTVKNLDIVRLINSSYLESVQT